MKKLHTTNLNQFVSDFNLSSENGVICFPANVDFKCSFTVLKLFVDVHIISIENLKMDVIYLLYSNREQRQLNLPDMFSINDGVTDYTKNECLVIKGNSIIYGDYKLEITPSLIPQAKGISSSAD